ncbi:MAG: hypothetical protein J6I56_01110, partial [Lachnospiraceae bacterium]|nr:hypothetical protein [Lachnospiraceae bacterium]
MQFKEIRISSVRRMDFAQEGRSISQRQSIWLFPNGTLQFLEDDQSGYIYRKWEMTLGRLRRFLVFRMIDRMLQCDIRDSGDEENYWT